MTGHFKNGEFVEEAVDDNAIANAALNATHAHFVNYNQQHPPAGVVWLQSTTGFMILCTDFPKYADQMKRFVRKLK